MYYILDGHTPVHVDALEWADFFQHANRVIERTNIDEHVTVSTVFLGLDHNFSREGPPVLFETLVFGGKFAGEMERYTTWDDAAEGHKKMVERVLNDCCV